MHDKLVFYIEKESAVDLVKDIVTNLTYIFQLFVAQLLTQVTIFERSRMNFFYTVALIALAL